MKIFKCDGNGCKSENNDNDVTGWLTIGTLDEGSLCMKNQLPNNAFSIMSNYYDLHFCSKECFINKFFETTVKQ